MEINALADDGDRATALSAGLAGAAEVSPVPMVILASGRPGSPILFANAAFARLTGHAREDAIGRRLEELGLEELALSGPLPDRAAPGSLDLGGHRKDGTPYRCRLHLSPAGDGLLGVVADIERTAPDHTLMRDFQHRVMNNLQFIVGLLEMQAKRSRSAPTRGAFLDLRARIEALAVVYRQLYQAQGEINVDIGVYLRQMAESLSKFYDPAGTVTVTVTASSTPVHIEHAFPLGLVVTELVVNSFKHAFIGRSSGLISITVDRPEPDRLTVIVADDGPGLEDAAPGKGKGSNLGLTIVRSLARQVGATVTMASDRGLRVSLSVPLRG